MFILAGLAFLQAVLLPGLLFHVAFWRSTPLRYALINTVPLSLMANYAIGFSLFSAGLLQRPIVLAVVGLEIFTLIIIAGRHRTELLQQLESLCKNLQFKFLPELRFPLWLFGSLLLLAFAFNFTTVFEHWDPVFSWNRWALDWFIPRWPVGTAHYPQLFPLSWSITYYIMGEELQFVPRAIMALSLPIFFLTPFCFFEGYKSRERAAVFALVLAGAFFIYLEAFIYDGYVDAPVAAWAFLAFSNLLQSEVDRSHTRYLVFVSTLILSMLPLVKQAGWVLYVPFFVELLRMRAFSAIRWRDVLIVVLTFVTFTISYYAITQYRISVGLDHSEIAYVTSGIYGNATLVQRWIAALHLLKDIRVGVGLLIIASVMVLIFGTFRKRQSRFLRLYFVAYFFFWMTMYSYDQRNLSVALPFLLYFAFLEIAPIVADIVQNRPGLKKTLSVAFMVVVLLRVPYPKRDQINAAQLQKQLQTGTPAVNEFLQRFYLGQPADAAPVLIGDYPYVYNVPAARSYFTHEFFGSASEVHNLIKSKPHAVLMITDELSSIEAHEAFAEDEKAGAVKRLFKTEHTTVYQVQ